MSEEPKSCPFCGNDCTGPIEEALHVQMQEHDWRDASWSVQCDKCTATMGYSDSKAEAIAAWNTRSERAEAEAAEAQVLDLDKEFYKSLCEAAAQSEWIPKEHYTMNDWVSDACIFLRTGKGIEARAEVERLREALMFYADLQNPRAWVQRMVTDVWAIDTHRPLGKPVPSEALRADRGNIARQALGDHRSNDDGQD